jgi:hypothetical protein
MAGDDCKTSSPHMEGEMKIYEHQGVIFNQTNKNDKKNISEKNSFQAIMDQVTSSSVNKGNNVPANIQTPFANGVGIIIKEESVNDNKEDVLNNLKDTLDLVDFYAEKLADSSLSSDCLSPLVEQLNERLNMLKEMESSTGMNDKLKTILSDVNTTIGVEIEKFRRGDYL